MPEEKLCIRCGRKAEVGERVNPSAAWWLCWKCTQEFCRARPRELAEWHREALRRYAETRNKAYLRFAKHFLEPCIPGQAKG